MNQNINNEKRLKILEAAKRLFAHFGFRKTSMEEIARKSHVGKGTLYLYFNSKEEIFRTLIMELAESKEVDLEVIASLDITAEDKFRRYIAAKIRLMDEFVNDWGITIEAMRESEFDPIVHDLRIEHMNRQTAYLHKIIEEGVDQGVFITDNAHLTATAIFAAFDILGKPWICEGLEVNREAKMNTLLSLFLQGILRRSD